MSDVKETRESRPREKITLDTLIPPLPSKSERLPPPDEDRHERELKILESKLTKLHNKKKEINSQIKEKKEGGKLEDHNISLKQFINNNFSTRKEKIAHRNKLRDEMDSLKREFFQMIDDQKKLKPKIKIFDRAKAEKQIEKVQHRIENTTLTLQEEKKLVSELSELQLSLPLISQHACRAKKIDENKARQEVLKAQIAAISEEIDETKNLIDESKNQLKDSKDQRNTEIPALAEERKKIEDEIKELENSRKQMQKEFKDKKLAFYKQVNQIKQIEWMMKMKNRIVEQEERKKKQEELKKLEEINKPHPYAKEIMSCDNFIAYLLKFIPKDTPENPEQKEKTDYLPAKVEQMAKESEEWFGKAEKKGKKKVKKNKKTENFLSNIPIDLLNFFSYIGIKVPTSCEEAKQAIEELKKRKTDWSALSTRQELQILQQHYEVKSVSFSLSPVNFPEPLASKYTEKYELFVDRGPSVDTKDNIRGKRGNRQYNK